MSKMPKRDITGKCRFGCRDRVLEGERERQREIDSFPYSTPSPNSPLWTRSRDEQPGVLGGRV